MRRLKKMEKERMQDAAGENLDKEDKKKKKCAHAARFTQQWHSSTVCESTIACES